MFNLLKFWELLDWAAVLFSYWTTVVQIKQKKKKLPAF